MWFGSFLTELKGIVRITTRVVKSSLKTRPLVHVNTVEEWQWVDQQNLVQDG